MDEILKLLYREFDSVLKAIKDSKQRFAIVEAKLEASFQTFVLKAEENPTKKKAIPSKTNDLNKTQEAPIKNKSRNIKKPSLAIGNKMNSTLLSDIFARPPNAAEKVPEGEFDDMPKLPAAAAEFKVPLPPVPALKPSKAPAAVFKVPLPPVSALKPISVPISAAVSVPKPTNDFKGFEESDEDDEDADMSKSIYKPLRTFAPELQDEAEDWEDPAMCSFVATADNKYEHTIVEEHDISLKVQEAILNSKGDPFSNRLREVMLEHCNFSQFLENRVNTCSLLKKIPQLKSGLKVECGGDEFKILKFVVKGSFGCIFTGKSASTGKIYALKQEKPPCLWEYYICVELRKRLKTQRMTPAFMQIDYAIIANNSSILITGFSTYGTIIDVCNKFRAVTTQDLHEYVAMVLTTQLLSIIGHLHRCKIIHADIKPDNFLVMSKIEFGSRTPALKLIDFGLAIDMKLYKDEVTFTGNVGISNFVCCEMLEKKPWTYQTDLFGLAGTSHAMLFGRYMEVQKKLTTWSIKARYLRYFNKPLWENYFSALLNVPDCFTMPDLQALMEQFEEFIQSKERLVRDKINEFNRVMDCP